MALGVFLMSGGSAQAQFAANPCSCYYDFECKATGRGEYCSYVGDCMGGNGCDCIIKPDVLLPTVAPYDQQFPNGVLICAGPANQPRCDGVCRSNRPNVASYENAKPEQVARAVELLMAAYIKSGKEFGGYPDPDLVNKARQVAMGLNLAWQKEILNAVHDTLLLLLGGDFLPPTGEPMFGQVPQFGPEQTLLVETVGAALVEGIRTGNPELVKNAVYDFWNENEWEPLHPDHCYSHGHSQAQSVDDCMAGQLSGLLTVLVDGQCLPGAIDCQAECDPAEPDCGGGGNECDPSNPDCGGDGGTECDPSNPDCGGGGGTECDPSNPDCGGDGGTECDPASQDCQTLSNREHPVNVNAVSRRTGKPLDGRRSRNVPWSPRVRDND
jgi:hypothetical protein